MSLALSFSYAGCSVCLVLLICSGRALHAFSGLCRAIPLTRACSMCLLRQARCVLLVVLSRRLQV